MRATARWLLAALLLAVAPPARALTPAEMSPFLRTTSDIHVVGAAMMSWLTSQVSMRSPATALPASGNTDVDVTSYPVISRLALETILVPQYISAVPELDGWGNPYEYRLASTFTQQQVMLIRSTGSDAVFEGNVYARGEIASFDQDLVWADGFDVRGPGPALRDLRQKAARTKAIASNVGAAMMSWLTDNVSRPTAVTTSTPAADCDLSLYQPMSAAEVSSRLAPKYISFVPELDDWGHPIDYYLDPGPDFGTQVMAIRLVGRDGNAQGSVYSPGNFPASDLDSDTVWSDGFFVRWPDDLTALLFLDDFESADERFWSGLVTAP